jgi:WD40 repeat protein
LEGGRLWGTSPDGAIAIVGTPDDRGAKLWDVHANREVATLEGQGWVPRKARFSPDGRTIGECEPNEIRLWDTHTGKLRASINAPDSSVIAFSPNGEILAAVIPSTKAESIRVKLWDTTTLSQWAELPGAASLLTFSPDGRTLATIESDSVTLWDIRARQVRATLKLTDAVASDVPYLMHAFSPNGALFCATNDSIVEVWNAITGERLTTLKGHLDRISILAWSPDGKTLATASGSKVKLWNVATWEELTTLVGRNGAFCIAFAPDGSLATADGLNTIHLWRTGLGHETRPTEK